MALSITGGEFWEGAWFSKHFTDDAPPRYGAFPSENTWFVTGGTWPSNNNDKSSDYYDISAKIRMNKKTK